VVRCLGYDFCLPWAANLPWLATGCGWLQPLYLRVRRLFAMLAIPFIKVVDRYRIDLIERFFNLGGKHGNTGKFTGGDSQPWE
jgi:hypothetical protein